MPSATEQPFAYDPFAPAVLDDPYPYYKRLLDEHPVYYNEARDFWTLSRFDDVQAAARDWKHLSSAQGVELDETQHFYPETFGSGNVVITDPPDHKRIRKVIHELLAPRAVRELEPAIGKIVARLLDRLEERATPDLAREFAWRVPVGTIGHILNLPASDHDYLADLLFDFETRESDEGDQDDYFGLPLAARKAGAELAAYIAAQLDDRRAHPGDDLLSALVAAEADGRLQPGEPRGLTFILIMAGIDTTACLISNALHRLQPLREARARLALDSNAMATAIEELIRFEAPVQGEARVALEDVVVDGHTIPKGSRVWLCFGAANRDERRFENPDVLDLERPIVRHLGFGEGIHHCIGAPLARLEGRVALEQFFARFPDYRLGQPAQRHHQHTTRGWVRMGAELG